VNRILDKPIIPKQSAITLGDELLKVRHSSSNSRK
jgi:hypothetical protein